MTELEIDPTNLRVDVYDPSHTYIGQLYDYRSIKSKIYEFGEGNADLELMFEAWACQHSYTKNSSTKTAYQWAFEEYSFDIIYKGQEWFSGPVVTCDDKDVTDAVRGDTIIDVNLGCWTWPKWLMEGRVIYGDSPGVGGRFAPSAGKADDVLKALLRAQMLAPASGGIEPSAYGVAGVDRENFGSITVAIAADTTSHPTTVTHRWDHGEHLWGAVMEFCRLYNLKITWSWSGSQITFDVEDATGTDRTSAGSGAIVFDRERGNLLSFSRKVDRGKIINAAEARGTGRRDSQVRGYAFDTDSQDGVGMREGGEVHRSGNTTDIANNSAFITEQYGGAEASFEAIIAEVPGIEYGDFLLGDQCLLFDKVRDVTVSDIISWGELSHVAGSEVDTKFGWGRAADNQTSSNSRSGGGGRGSKRGGGKPKNKDGESIVDPDDINSIEEIYPDRGATLVLDEPNDTLDIKKNISANSGDMTFPNIRTYGVDPGSGAGTREKLLLGVMGTLVAACVQRDLWWRVEFDTNGDGDPDVVRYIPTYKLATGAGGSNPPAPEGACLP